MKEQIVKPYFCLWFDDNGMKEEFFDNFLDALDCAMSCEISQQRCHFGDTQGGT